MARKSLFDRLLSRRELLKLGLGTYGFIASGLWLEGCATASGSQRDPLATTSPVTGSRTSWARGGTAAMKGGYPDPFTTRARAAATCELACEQIKGPCYAGTVVRRDISEGLPGLPLRLSLRIVRAGSCKPVPNTTVDIWHTNAVGVYSEFAAQSFCNPTDTDLRRSKFCRGVQTTDAKGRVDFDTVFPGWYRGRTVHIHFTIRLANQEYVTSQLYFDDALTTQIYTRHPDYASRPHRDTTNHDDGVAGGQVSPFLLATARMADGVLQAYKTIAIRSSLNESSCAI